uniref:Uncharacterized protein n=1 Tax=Oryza glumipatula TaxID=40148 RepID=A0A0D9ZJK2_9ORYZ
MPTPAATAPCRLHSNRSPLRRRRSCDLSTTTRRGVAAPRRRRRRVSGDVPPLAPPCAEPIRLGPSHHRAPLLGSAASGRKKTTGKRKNERERNHVGPT